MRHATLTAGFLVLAASLTACNTPGQSTGEAPVQTAAHHHNFDGPATGSILSGDDVDTGSNVDHNGAGVAAMQGSHGGPGVMH